MNNINITLIAIVALLMGGIGGYAIHGVESGNVFDRSSFEQKKGDVSYGMHRMGDGTLMEDHSMGGFGMHHVMVTSEKSFLEEMIPHHQEAVDTAKEVLERGGTTPEMKTLAENIVTAQEKEIADMKQWYETWYGTSYQDKGTYQPMMRNLTELSGTDLDKAFLSDMIRHHMGAIMMARSVQPYVEHDEMKQLSSNIIATQSEEITLMRGVLTKLQ